MLISELNDNELKELKKKLKLPIKKELIYFEQISHLNFQSHKIVDFEIFKEFSESVDSKVLKVYLENGDTINILSDYLSEMQKSNFVEIVSK